MLVVASIVDKASYPVTGWVGQGVAADWVLIDTNNFFWKEGTFQNGEDISGQNLQVAGGEQINLRLVGGLKGSVETQDILLNPKNTSGVQPLTVAASLPDAGSGPAHDNSASADSGGGGGGAGCFISVAASGL